MLASLCIGEKKRPIYWAWSTELLHHCMKGYLSACHGFLSVLGHDGHGYLALWPWVFG